ncbi:hypothetical protein ARMSODRAFT_982349 [Armillaria solidipes]|uniref:Uncharacterized protein n=1 Tax=Armillaria solidipes TaxID=1076256 RepID=A0A2H3B750_9AGAR|nr:hypothetical protein ARMSODRAFT_982349 [Armillaria solidipes]
MDHNDVSTPVLGLDMRECLLNLLELQGSHPVLIQLSEEVHRHPAMAEANNGRVAVTPQKVPSGLLTPPSTITRDRKALPQSLFDDEVQFLGARIRGVMTKNLDFLSLLNMHVSTKLVSPVTTGSTNEDSDSEVEIVCDFGSNEVKKQTPSSIKKGECEVSGSPTKGLSSSKRPVDPGLKRVWEEIEEEVQSGWVDKNDIKEQASSSKHPRVVGQREDINPDEDGEKHLKAKRERTSKEVHQW